MMFIPQVHVSELVDIGIENLGDGHIEIYKL